MKKTLFITILFLSSLLILNISYAQNEVSCYFKNECGIAEHCLFSLFQENDSHIGDCNYYNLKLCCSGFSKAYIINGLCQNGEGTVLTFNYNNSHVGEGTYTGIGNYGNYSVCVKFPFDAPQVSVKSSCDLDEACIISKFKLNDSHVGSCSYYENKICVKQPPLHTGTDISAIGRINVIIKNITEEILNLSISPEELFAVLEPNKIYKYTIIIENHNKVDIDLQASIICPKIENISGTYEDIFCNFINFEYNETLKSKVNFTVPSGKEYKLNITVIIPQDYKPIKENITITFNSAQGLIKTLSVKFIEQDKSEKWYEKLYNNIKFYLVEFWNLKLIEFTSSLFNISGIYGSTLLILTFSIILVGSIVWLLRMIVFKAQKKSISNE